MATPRFPNRDGAVPRWNRSSNPIKNPVGGWKRGPDARYREGRWWNKHGLDAPPKTEAEIQQAVSTVLRPFVRAADGSTQEVTGKQEICINGRNYEIDGETGLALVDGELVRREVEDSLRVSAYVDKLVETVLAGGDYALYLVCPQAYNEAARAVIQNQLVPPKGPYLPSHIAVQLPTSIEFSNLVHNLRLCMSKWRASFAIQGEEKVFGLAGGSSAGHGKGVRVNIDRGYSTTQGSSAPGTAAL